MFITFTRRKEQKSESKNRPSVTVILNWHVEILPLSSVANAVTVVVVTGNSAATKLFPNVMNSRLPLMYWTVAIPQSSFAQALGN